MSATHSSADDPPPDGLLFDSSRSEEQSSILNDIQLAVNAVSLCKIQGPKVIVHASVRAMTDPSLQVILFGSLLTLTQRPRRLG